MAKRSNTRRVDKQDSVVVVEDTGESPSETVRLACVLGAIVKIGPPQYSKEYVFNMGDPQDVDLKDAEILLAKRKGCCGTAPKPIFVTV